MNHEINPHATQVKCAPSNIFLAATRAIVVVVASAVLLLAFLIHQAIVGKSKKLRVATLWTRKWAESLLRISGIDVIVRGEIPPTGSLLVPNHSGYVDVLALGSLVPCFFVAKAEISAWPGIGTLFDTTHHIGLSREKKQTLHQVVGEVAKRLTMGHTVCAFLEGTSTGNDRLLPLRPPLLQSAIEAQAAVVPVGIHWKTNHKAISIPEDVAYWKDHVFGKHAWRLMGLHGIQAEVRFGKPITPTGISRKKLAALLQQQLE